jgi:hypothetical protein
MVEVGSMVEEEWMEEEEEEEELSRRKAKSCSPILLSRRYCSARANQTREI